MTINLPRMILVASLAFVLAACTATPGRNSETEIRGHAADHPGHKVTPPGPVIPDAATHHGARTPWTSLEFLDGEERFHFLVVTDNTGGARPGVFADAMRRVNLMQPAFVVSVGDLIEGYTRDYSALNAEWDEFEGYIAKLDAPFFYVPGNHDYTNTEMGEIWEQRFGQSYYHFRYKDVLFVAMNAELFDLGQAPWRWHQQPQQWHAAQQAQLDYVEKVLQDNTDVRWTFVFLHQPYWRPRWIKPPESEESPANGPWPTYDYVHADWAKIEGWMHDRNYTTFAGHLHTYDYTGEVVDGHTHDKIALATTGGVSQLRGVGYGEFDQLVWVTMTEDGPVIANLLLEGILDKDFKMPKQRPYWVD